MALEIVVSAQENSPLTLAEAFCGRSGKLVLGEQGIRLWAPESDVRGEGEIVCDLRNYPVSDTVLEEFTQAAEGRFLSVRVVMLGKKDENAIAHARKYFDYVLIPDAQHKNDITAFKRHVLGFAVEEKE